MMNRLIDKINTFIMFTERSCANARVWVLAQLEHLIASKQMIGNNNNKASLIDGANGDGDGDDYYDYGYGYDDTMGFSDSLCSACFCEM